MEYLYTIVMLMALYVILASSFNFVIGNGGLISIAHPVFYAIGAYGSGLLSMRGWPVPLAMAGGGLCALLASVLVALSSLRVSGDYLLIASIGFQLGLLEAIKNVEWTGGPGGLSNIPGFLADYGGHAVYVGMTIVLAAATVLLLRWISTGPFGRAMSAMQDDELAYAALGRNIMLMKVAIFALGSGIAGLAGALYAHYFRFLAPAQFDILQSAALLTMVVVGGIRTAWGPVLGAIVLEALPQAITFLDLPPAILGPLQGLLFTGLVLIFMFARPQGLLGAGAQWQGAQSRGTQSRGGQGGAHG